MSFIKASDQITNLKDDEQRFRYIQIFLQNVKNTINGNISLSQNISLVPVSVNFLTADTDTVVEHGLGRVPRGYLVVSRSSGLIVYDGDGASTVSNISLKSTAVGVASIIFM